MLGRAYDDVKPDLVLFTGDNILGNHLLDARFGSRQVAHGYDATRQRMEKALGHILKPLEERKIPFGMIYGNHDDMNCLTKQEQIEIYKKYEMCLPLNAEDSQRDVDTYNIPIYSSDGNRLLFNLWMLDTAWQDKKENKCYTQIKPQAVKWFEEKSEELKKESQNESLPSILFMHIPLPQQMALCKQCDENTAGAMRGPGGKYYVPDETKFEGTMGEIPSVCTDDAGLFETIKENGSVLAVVAGHDHRNCFDATVDGVRFIQTSCASFRCYGNKLRGVRLFILDENEPNKFETKMLTYEQIMKADFKSISGIKAKVRYLLDADELEKKKLALMGAAGAIAAATIAVKAVKNYEKK